MLHVFRNGFFTYLFCVRKETPYNTRSILLEEWNLFVELFNSHVDSATLDTNMHVTGVHDRSVTIGDLREDEQTAKFKIKKLNKKIENVVLFPPVELVTR
jgi:hypothetical protein